MRMRLARLLVASVLAVLTLAPSASAAVGISVDRMQVATALGTTFSFQTTITNQGSAPISGLVAHLNVLAVEPGPYVDPEDWSSRRTVYLPPIPAGGSRTLTWKLKAVNAGTFGAYVALPSRSEPTAQPVVSDVVRIEVAKRQTLNSGGILPLALGMPLFLGLAAVGVRVRRRRR